MSTFHPDYDALSSAQVHALTDLSAREKQVLRLIARGYTNDEAAVALDLSVETVKTYVKGCLRKLGAKTRAHAVALGIERGQI